MFNFLNSKNDSELKEDVLNELSWDPSISAKNIYVSIMDGVVALKGSVPHFSEKLSVEHAIQRVAGVRAIVDELDVKDIIEKTDEEIALACLSVLNWSYSVPSTVKVTVDQGWLTLTGAVDWNYQRNAAREAVSKVLGVYGVSNDIIINEKPILNDIKKSIEDAIDRSHKTEKHKINIDVNGNEVVLSGEAMSIAEMKQASLAAWSAPGVISVKNNIHVVH